MEERGQAKDYTGFPKETGVHWRQEARNLHGTDL
jgi:hypothetical protein